ncbi:phosphotransferase [Actinomadura kijaniata]|uniref:phosphotransferase n=1 Tax=Actinomadura kijaniata TaxID=46161 RepID=UPI003F1E38A9
MLERPEDLREDELLRMLGEWGLGDVSLRYAAVGFGDHHWVAEADRRWFVTVADLVTKGDTLDGLRAAMDTAHELRGRDGLDFVVAPLPTPAGQTVRPLGPRYAVSVFPFLDGVSGEFGREWTPRERADVLGLLAVLHRQRPPAAAPVLRPELGLRGLLEKALAGSLQWAEGPFSDPARNLLREYAPVLRQRLAEFDALVTGLDGAPVVTHGEPHPGNLLSHDGGYALVDWDTAGLAPHDRGGAPTTWPATPRSPGGPRTRPRCPSTACAGIWRRRACTRTGSARRTSVPRTWRRAGTAWWRRCGTSPTSGEPRPPRKE